jgi:hypothetical protein
VSADSERGVRQGSVSLKLSLARWEGKVVDEARRHQIEQRRPHHGPPEVARARARGGGRGARGAQEPALQEHGSAACTLKGAKAQLQTLDLTFSSACCLRAHLLLSLSVRCAAGKGGTDYCCCVILSLLNPR